MFRELCNPVTMRLMALGHPLHKAERLAAVIVLWIVVLCTMTGYSLSIEGVPQQARDEVPLPRTPMAQSSVVAGIRGILPARAGIAGTVSRTLLQR